MGYTRQLRKLAIGALSAGNNTIVAGGQLGAAIGQIRVWQLNLTSSAATVVSPYSNTTAIPGQLNFAANGTVELDNTEQPWMETLPGQALIWNLTIAATFTGEIFYSIG